MVLNHSFIDARGISVTLPCNPHRIVSLICSITETLFALGLEDRIAGRTNYCTRPMPQVESAKKIGGPKNPDIEAILALNPDLVIANIEENEKNDIERLENEGIPVFVTYPRTVKDSLELIRTLGLITGKEHEADAFYRKAENVVHKILKQVASMQYRPNVAYLIWREPYMAINRDTYIHDMITVCGGINIYAEYPQRYPEITIEDIVDAKPDIIFLPSEPFPFKKKHIKEFMRYRAIPAVRNNRVLTVNGEFFSWFGVRMIFGLPYVRKIFADYK
ncbi:hypothetical protein AMJ80_10985 [bacterium SM23_31]|nr:MAG: hypothetical protein AMJ80_10985 [bacterium SM23_31]